jgi:hypothetical protein
LRQTAQQVWPTPLLEGTDPRNALSLNGQFVTGEIFAKEKFSTVKQPAQDDENQT